MNKVYFQTQYFNFLLSTVSLRTTRFNIKKFYMMLALRWVFCTDLRKEIVTFDLYVIKWLVFITVVESVYSAVRNDFLYKADYF